VADLGQGAQLGDLPEPIRQQLGWQPPPTSREPTMEFTPRRRRPATQLPTHAGGSHPAPLPRGPGAAVGRGWQRLRHPGPHRRGPAQGRVAQEEIDSFFAEATSGDYDHLLQTTMAWVGWQ
jgi:hypothetical protein